MHEHKVPLLDAVRVRGCVFALAAVEFAADEARVNVGGGFEGYGTGVVGGVEVEDGAVDCVEIGADCCC